MSDAKLEQQLSWHWLLTNTFSGKTHILGFTTYEKKILLDAINDTSTAIENSENNANHQPGLVIINVDECHFSDTEALVQKARTVALIGRSYNIDNWRVSIRDFKNIKEYGLLPATQPRVVIPLNKRRWTRTALGLHRPGRRIAQLAISCARVFYRVVKLPFLFKRQLIIANREHACLPPHGVTYTGIELKAEQKNFDFALYLGTTDANRKTVILPLGNDEPNRIIKLAETPDAKISLTREAEALNVIANSAIAGQIPRLLAFHNSKRSIALHLEYQIRCSTSSSQMHAATQDFMIALAALDRCEINLSDYLEKNFTITSSLLAKEKALLLALQQTARRGAVLQTHRVHGDFAPWNCSWTSKGFFVFDWEESCSDGLALSDACHYMLAPALLINNYGQPETIVNQILSTTGIFAEKIALDSKIVHLHLSVWLLQWAQGRQSPILDKLRDKLLHCL